MTVRYSLLRTEVRTRAVRILTLLQIVIVVVHYSCLKLFPQISAGNLNSVTVPLSPVIYRTGHTPSHFGEQYRLLETSAPEKVPLGDKYVSGQRS